MQSYLIFTVLNLIILILFATTSPHFCSVDGCQWMIFVIFPALIGFISTLIFFAETHRRTPETKEQKYTDTEILIRDLTSIIFLIAYVGLFTQS